MIGARALTHEVSVTFRRLRPHERISTPPGYRAIVATASTLEGLEEAFWLVPQREAKRALNPHYKQPARDLAAGIVPPGWILAKA